MSLRSLPVDNSFSPLRLVKNNSMTAQIRPDCELPQGKRVKPSHAEPKKKNAAINIYRAYVTVKKGGAGGNKNAKGKKFSKKLRDN